MSNDDTGQVPELFDPSGATVDQVNEYLATADADERERVLGLEDAPEGKGRATITREFPADSPTEADELAAVEPQGTKGATFQEAAEQVQEQAPVLPIQVTSTDTLAADGDSKGLTFAEQAEKARELYGSGNPSQED